MDFPAKSAYLISNPKPPLIIICNHLVHKELWGHESPSSGVRVKVYLESGISALLKKISLINMLSRDLMLFVAPARGSIEDGDVFVWHVYAQEHSRRVKRTASLAASNLVDPWRGIALQALASNLESVGSQVNMAGRAVMSARQNGASTQLQNAASDHFNLIKRHWTECAERTRNLVDEAIDAKAFIKAQGTSYVSCVPHRFHWQKIRYTLISLKD